MMDGSPHGILAAEISNWSGKAIRIQRVDVAKCEREDIRGIGVYFLICKEDDGADSVYIGEAENIYDRLCQHLRDYEVDKERYYWSTAVCFTGRLDKALIRYLESRLVDIARDGKRYKVLTKNTYKNMVMRETQKAGMEEFIENVQVLMSAMGYKMLDPVPVASEETSYFFCQNNGSDARGYDSQDGFVVLKDSVVAAQGNSKSFTNSLYARLREKLIKDGIIQNNILKEDYVFSSPSAAASVVSARYLSGRGCWLNKEGKKLKDVELRVVS